MNKEKKEEKAPYEKLILPALNRTGARSKHSLNVSAAIERGIAAPERNGSYSFFLFEYATN